MSQTVFVTGFTGDISLHSAWQLLQEVSEVWGLTKAAPKRFTNKECGGGKNEKHNHHRNQ